MGVISYLLIVIRTSYGILNVIIVQTVKDGMLRSIDIQAIQFSLNIHLFRYTVQSQPLNPRMKLQL